jgi:ABC-type transport system involved in multi-copper enzyme maturation permease subunit
LLGPLFNRELLTVPRRSRHYLTRAAYLGALWILGLTAWQATVGWNRTATLGETARFGLLLFQIFTLVQLTLILFFAAMSAASAVAQEKDRRTFILLLLTDLRSYEIVLGKLMGSMLQILLLLAGTVPLLMLLVLLGGVSPKHVVEAVVIMAATALAAGSLGSVVALWRDKTFQALALTVLFLVLYLSVVPGLALIPGLGGEVGAGDATSATSATAWQQWLNPFQALQAVLGESTSTAAIPVAYGFAGMMVLWAVLLNGLAILRLRVWNPSGEPIMQREQPDEAAAEEKDRLKAHAAPGLIRHVWENPILWREIRTRAYGRRGLLVKLAYIVVLALLCYYTLSPLRAYWHTHSLSDRPAFAAAWGVVPVAFLSLLLVSAQAVTAITSERDTGALDLLLVTDLTPREFIFGKLGGIGFNTILYLLPPIILTVLFAVWGLLATPPHGHPELVGPRNGEAFVFVTITLLVLLFFVMVLGIHVALRNMNSRVAIINTLGTVFFLTMGTAVSIGLILINGRFEYQWTSFLFFLGAGIGGLWWVLNGNKPSPALGLASWFCPPAVFYCVMNLLIAKPGSDESADPLIPALVLIVAFGFTISAMLIPLISEFDVALGRTTAGGE